MPNTIQLPGKHHSVIELQRHICASEGNICPKLVGSDKNIQFVAHPCPTVEFGFSEFRSTHLHTCVLMKLDKGSLQMNSSSYCLSNRATLNIYIYIYSIYYIISTLRFRGVKPQTLTKSTYLLTPLDGFVMLLSRLTSPGWSFLDL